MLCSWQWQSLSSPLSLTLVALMPQSSSSPVLRPQTVNPRLKLTSLCCFPLPCLQFLSSEKRCWNLYRPPHRQRINVKKNTSFSAKTSGFHVINIKRFSCWKMNRRVWSPACLSDAVQCVHLKSFPFAELCCVSGLCTLWKGILPKPGAPGARTPPASPPAHSGAGTGSSSCSRLGPALPPRVTGLPAAPAPRPLSLQGK